MKGVDFCFYCIACNETVPTESIGSSTSSQKPTVTTTQKDDSSTDNLSGGGVLGMYQVECNRTVL